MIFLWIITSLILISLGLIFVAVLKHSTNTSSTENEDDLAEWICQTCGFHVQLGNECIYCGEKKTVVKKHNWAN
ncbi:MAG: hypothetical protein IIA61_01580 [Candidatus Marinimicrobia bacterium]|nr:hypothetical protein [Candidatus Neomarinimicrobiota bacterium]